MDSSSSQRAGHAARTGLAGSIVAAVAFLDGVFIGAPIALLSASLRPLWVFAFAAVAVSFVAMACCGWVNRRWDDWLSGSGARMEKRFEAMRTSRLMRHPVRWIQEGSDRSYAFAAALANPILVAAFARFVGGKPVSDRRIVLGAVAYAVPYAAMWSLVGFALGDTVSRVA
jgi:hypothetical protein